MTRLLVALLLPISIGVALSAPVPVVPFDPTKDREGNPLPKGATARLGSLAFRSQQVQSLAFSPDSKRVLVASRQQLTVWDSDTGKTLPGKFAPPPEIAKRQSHIPVVVGSNVVWIGPPEMPTRTTEVVVADFEGHEVTRFEYEGLSHGAYAVNSADTAQYSISRDGKYFAVIVERGTLAAVYDLQRGKRLHAQKLNTQTVRGLALSSSTNVLFVREGKALRRYKLDTGEALPAFAEELTGVELIAVSPDGKRMITGTKQIKRITPERGLGLQPEETLVLRDPNTGKRMGVLELGANPHDFAFIGNDSVIVAASQHRYPAQSIYTFSLWNLTTGKREWEVPALSGFWLAVSPDGTKFAGTNGAQYSQAYDAQTGKLLYTPPGHTDGVAWVAFSADGKSITTAGSGEVINWNLKGERKERFALPELRSGRILPPPLGAVGTDHLMWLAFTDDECITPQIVCWDREKNKIGWRVFLSGRGPEWLTTHDGKHVLSTVVDGAKRAEFVTIHDGTTGETLHEWKFPLDPQGGNGKLKFLSGDGKVLFIAASDAVQALDPTTGKEVARVKLSLTGNDIRSYRVVLASTTDGSRIAVYNNASLSIYDVKSGKLLVQHPLPGNYSTAAKFSPDGKQVAVWPSATTGVLLCSAETDSKPRLFDGGLSRPACVAFNATQTSLAVGYLDSTTLIWDLTAK
jgi:WD40 repeat protein